MPPAEALPDSIADLAARRGAVVRDEYPDDLQPVLREIELHLSSDNVTAARNDVATGERRLPYPHPPLVVKPAALSDDDVETALAELLPESDVADFADKANHHPRWENIFKTLRVYLTTWDIGHRISPLDIQLAQFFDRTYKRRHVDG